VGATWHVVASVHCPVGGPEDPGPYSGADSFTFVRLLLRDPDGVEGTGVTGRFLAPEVAHFLNRVVPDVLNRGSHDPVADIAKQFNPRQMGGVVVSGLSALDIALTDIRAKRSGQSVASVLGGQRRAAPVHVTCGFPELDTDALVESCGREVAAGALGVKVLIAAKGRTVAQDLARLSAARDAIGPRAELIADANCRMDMEAALAFVRGAGDLNLTWLEEPVRGNDTAGLATSGAGRAARRGTDGTKPRTLWAIGGRRSEGGATQRGVRRGLWPGHTRRATGRERCTSGGLGYHQPSLGLRRAGVRRGRAAPGTIPDRPAFNTRGDQHGGWSNPCPRQTGAGPIA